MIKIAENKVSDIYQGGYSSLDPSKRTNIAAGSLGLTTDPRTANLLKEVSGKLSTGVKQIELEFVSPEVFDSMPKQQLTEVRRLAKLTGIDLSVHGPVIDTTGITQQGFSELNREASEKRIIQTIERSHEVKPDGNLIVNFHSAEGISGTEFKTLGEGRVAKKLIAVNRESGKLAPMEEETLFYPALKEPREDLTQKEIRAYQEGKLSDKDVYEQIPLEKGKLKTPESRLDTINDTEWDNSISQLMFNKERADEILAKNQAQIQHILPEVMSGDIKPEVLQKSPSAWQAYMHLQNAKNYLNDTRQHVDALFHKAYKYGDDKQKEALKQISENFKKDLATDKSPWGQSNALQTLMVNLRSPGLTPEMYVPVEDFAVEQSSKTFGNAAFASWKKFEDTAPIVAIENPPAGFALSTGEDLRRLVKESRKHFEKRLVEEEGFSKKKAEQQAEKLIGATWDVGHINMIRKQGFEEEDILKETEKIAPFVKHVHLSDNFGFEHTELPMGMGNVPTQEIMKRLGKKGFEASKIIEAAQWWQHFQSSPVQETMEAMGSPIYSMKMSQYWDQSGGLQQGYMSGYGMMLPQTHYQMFGAGFAQLPTELGGQMPGAQGSRMSGRGME